MTGPKKVVHTPGCFAGPLAASTARSPPSSGNQGASAQVPGPGHYNVEGAYEALRSGRFRESSFPKAKVVVTAEDESPGICYDTERQEHIIGGALPRSTTCLMVPSTPGPEYRPHSTLSRKGAVYMGEVPWLRNRRRPSSAPPAAQREDAPTPTAATSTNSRAASMAAPVLRGFSFGTSKRLPDCNMDAPGFLYVPPSTLRPCSASCLNGHRPEEAKLELRPGPHTYDISRAWHAPSAQFGSAKRSFTEPNRLSSALGPGTYVTEIPKPVKAAPIDSGPKTRFSSICSAQPGPGAYDPAVPLMMGGGNRSTFARAPRDPQPQDHSHLGGERRAQIIRSFFRAGSTTAASLRSRGVRLPPPRLSARSKCSKTSGPGPGAFEVGSGGVQRSCVFGKAPRMKQSELAEGPGPGEYAVDFNRKSSKGGKMRPKSPN